MIGFFRFFRHKILQILIVKKILIAFFLKKKKKNKKKIKKEDSRKFLEMEFDLVKGMKKIFNNVRKTKNQTPTLLKHQKKKKKSQPLFAPVLKENSNIPFSTLR